MLRRTLLMATAASAVGLVGAREPASACDMPLSRLVAQDELPPSPTVFLLSNRLFYLESPMRWTLKADRSPSDVLRARQVVEGAGTTAYHGGAPVPERLERLEIEMIGEVVVGHVHLDVSEGELVTFGEEDALPVRDLDDNEWHGKHRRVVANTPAPWTRITLQPDDSDPYYANTMLVGREGPVVSLLLEGAGIGVWSVTTPRCQDQLVFAGMIHVPEVCLDGTRRVVVVARAFDGSVIRAPVDVGPANASPRRNGRARGADVAGALVFVVLALTARRWRRLTPALP